ncbi:ABC transporter permease [Segnochrobactrum spirostomi]|uniref:ABC transporter permease n=1 Tax=Segnochrobactrum spirostomi TaxID=2608987 RepID=A0A6A7Y6M0_9HYPH|nr:ABC transporter permease [Segnochrobactrum spirostomi]MQT14960.1 ABC transporter permease [Segnochrobactrum spirostomi]
MSGADLAAAQPRLRLMPGPLPRLILRRLALSVISLFAVATIVFWVIALLPGDAAERILGRDATPAALAALRAQLHLADPLLVRYLAWLRGMLAGDFGMSMAASRPVLPYVLTHLQNTLLLAGIALAVHIPLSIGLGLAGAAARRDGPLDTGLSVAVLIGMSVPEFVVGIALVAWLATAWSLFPPLALIDQAHTVGDFLYLTALPVITLNFAMTAYVVRQTRASMVEVLRSDHVRAATLRGLSPLRVLVFHALPGALPPAINAVALNAAWLVGGIVVVETVFNYPGLGRLLVESIGFHDVPMIQGAAIALSGAYIAVNLVADIVTLLLNPKLRTAA